MKAITVANYFKQLFIESDNKSEGERLDLIKLHCSLFYIQAYYLLMYGKELFEEEILAHEHGPCIIEIGCPDKPYPAHKIRRKQIENT